MFCLLCACRQGYSYLSNAEITSDSSDGTSILEHESCILETISCFRTAVCGVEIVVTEKKPTQQQQQQTHKERNKQKKKKKQKQSDNNKRNPKQQLKTNQKKKKKGKTPPKNISRIVFWLVFCVCVWFFGVFLGLLNI